MDGIDLMASAMEAMKARLDVAAANLANASSDGFHRNVARVSLNGRGLAASTTTDAAQGALRRTGRPLDLAATGSGGFMVRDARGKTEVVTTGSFVSDPHGRLVDAHGLTLLGTSGPIRASESAAVDRRGFVRDGDAFAGRLRLSGAPEIQSGVLVASNVDAIREMVDVLTSQRAFETAQKALGAIDDARAKATNELARVHQ